MLIGITIGSKGPLLSPQALIDMKDLGMTCLRFQAPLSLVKSTGFAIYDDAVHKCNAANIDITLVIKHFPDTPGFPSPTEAGDMAVALASRYDGAHGHGTVQVIEIGNEDYGYSDFGALASAMNAAYPRVKAVNPHVLVTPGSTLQRNTTNMKAALTTLFKSAGSHIDCANLHTYFGIPASGPHVPQDGSVANVPSFPQYVQAAQSVAAACGYPHMPIWITEFGFACTSVNHGSVVIFSEADMWKHTQYCLDQGLLAGVERMYIFTLGYGGDGMSLVQPHGHTIAYGGVRTWIAAHGGNTPPPPPPPPDPIQQAIALLQQAKAFADAQGDGLIDQAISLLQS
jgi:hypothetical protein